MLQVCHFLVPNVRDSDHVPHSAKAYELLRDRLIAEFGGVSIDADGIVGYWKSANGAVIQDISRRYAVAIDHSKLLQLRELVRGLCGPFDQQCIYFETCGLAELLS